MTDIVLYHRDLDASVANALGQISQRSKQVYESDVRVLVGWLSAFGYAPADLTRDQAIAYRNWLGNIYEPATAKRMLSIARRVFEEMVLRGGRAANPFLGVKGFSVNNETPYTALRLAEAKHLLSVIDQTKKIGLRDYAMLSLLLRTGIRRSECAALDVGDLVAEQGHTTGLVRHGKGNKRRKVKIPPDVLRAISAYLAARQDLTLEAPLFVAFDRWDRPTARRLNVKTIERTVKAYGEQIGTVLTPHSLRASFITLALEGGASILQVQYAAGHDDPRTTERYQKRKVNLDNNAVDFIHME